jgi:hypothetical protein
VASGGDRQHAVREVLTANAELMILRRQQEKQKNMKKKKKKGQP